MGFDRLDLRAHRIGLGLAAVGRPGYINLGRGRDLPAGRSVDDLRARSHELLDAAYAAGVRYVDVARSYGRAEEFLAAWLPGRPDVVVGSKWGYTYTAGWQVTAAVHEAKDHSPATFERQLAETRAVLGDRLDLYQIHSVTPDSPALTDRALHRLLAELAATGVTVGLSVSGPGQAAAIRAALRVEAGGEPLFHTVQATWNLLEPSAGTALAEAHADGRAVIVKEAMANGRLAARDAEAIGAALAQPWAPLVLSGAATVPQLLSNLRALGPALSSTVDASPSPSPSSSSSLSSSLSASLPAETPEVYWATRSGLAWS